MIEGWFGLDPRPQGEQMCETNEQSHRNHVIGDGLDEGVPGKAAPDENVRPELGWSRIEFEGRQTAWKQNVAQIAEKDPGSGGQFDQKPRNRAVLLGLHDGWDCRHISPY